MSKKNSNIYDVAQKAGISIATVSRVLNNPDKVSPKTKDKVFSVMKELGFTPKAEARARAKKDTGRIGVITTDLTYPSFIHRLRGISETLDGTPYELVIITMKDKKDIDYYLRSIELTDKLDGLIILSQKLNDTTINLLNELSINVIFVEFGEINFPSISIDNNLGGEMVADYLLEKKYKTFSILTEEESDKKVHPNQMRVTGFINRLKQNGANITPQMVFYGSNDLKQSIKIAISILSKEIRPEVIFATTDLLAVAVIKAAKKLNISIPTELGVIGFDGTNTSDYLDFTTVDQSLEESGRLAAELLLKKIKKPNDPVHNILLPLKIIERDTIK